MKKKIRSNPKNVGSNCPLTSNPQARADADRSTAAIKDHFPPGLSQPALRALVAAGFSRLDQLAKVPEAELAKLHGMGPTGIKILLAALKGRKR